MKHTGNSLSARELAVRLWSHFVNHGAEPVDVAHTLADVDRLLTALEAGFRRSVGAEGYAALLRRATLLSVESHPALFIIPELAVERESDLNGTTYRAADVADGMLALLTTLIALLGRIIGVKMTARLLEQISVPSPRGVVSTTNRDASHD